MTIWSRLKASWTLYWALTGAILASALTAGLATASGRLQPLAGLSLTATLLVIGVRQCHPLPDRWLRRRARPLVRRGFELGRQGHSEEAIAVYDEFLTRWGGQAGPKSTISSHWRLSTTRPGSNLAGRTTWGSLIAQSGDRR